MTKIFFWALVTLDLGGIVLLFLLGLAAAGSTRDHPLHVAFLLLLLPTAVLGGAVLLFVKASSPWLRALAFLLAAAPLVIAVSARAWVAMQISATTDEQGEMTYFRAGAERNLVEAIRNDDPVAAADALKKVDVNETGVAGMTFLGLAMRQLDETPEKQRVLPLLLAAGANPNRSAQYDYPLASALRLSSSAGPGPVKLLLDAGADPDQRDSFGSPVLFAAVGKSSSREALQLVLDRGGDINAVAKDGQTLLFEAVHIQDWDTILYLLERGADWTLGHSVEGLPFQNYVEGYAGHEDPDGKRARVVEFMRQRLR